MSHENNDNSINNNNVNKPTKANPISSSSSSSSSPQQILFPCCDTLLRLTKTAITLSLLLSITLFLSATLSKPSFSRPNPTRWFTLPSFPSHAQTPSTCHSPNTSDKSPTQLAHLVFGLGGSSKTWEHRRLYSELWWVNNVSRGFVWLDGPLDANVTASVVGLGPETRVSSPLPGSGKASDRIARVLKDSFNLGLPSVRWFVMGDDDTVFFTENLVKVLSKYDHNEMYYVGGVSESVEQDVMHGYDTAFGGGGFAISYPLACELVRILDGCIERYHNFYGSDEKVAACVAELGVPLTRESGFHQLDIREDPYGLLAAHPVAPLVSLHHLDHVKPLFPGQTQIDALKRLMNAYHVDPGHTLQQSFCYDYRRKWSVSLSWGYTAQLYPSLVPTKALSTPLQTFRTWRSWSDGPFVFNTRPFNSESCDGPVIYFLDQVEDVGDGKVITIYKRIAAARTDKSCNQSAYKYAMSVEKITVSSLKESPDTRTKAPRRQCCEIMSGWTMKSNMRVKIRSCKPGESATV